MPNWIEGTMKLRGKREDIYRFFKEGLDPCSWAGEIRKIEDQVFDFGGKRYLDFGFRDEPHIKGTRRAFITDTEAYMEADEDIVCVNVKQAWAFSVKDTEDLENWKAISEEYNIDIKLFGIESGMKFTQELIIIRGTKPIMNVRKYDNWVWDCPFPHMGG